MGQILHGSATTTEAIRRPIQHSQESLRALATRYGVNPKIVAKWKQRNSVADQPTGPKQPHSTALSIEDEVILRRLPATISAGAINTANTAQRGPTIEDRVRIGRIHLLRSERTRWGHAEPGHCSPT